MKVLGAVVEFTMEDIKRILIGCAGLTDRKGVECNFVTYGQREVVAQVSAPTPPIDPPAPAAPAATKPEVEELEAA